MSVLTSDETNKLLLLIKKLISINIVLSILAYFGGWIFFGYLIHDPMKASFHDNSLLPGLASREFVDADHSSVQLLRQLQNATDAFPDNYFPVNLLREQFEQIGRLEVYEHRFRFRYPFGYDGGKVVEGSNLYAVLRAPRATSTESIVISTPYRSSGNRYGSTLPSIAIMMSLAKFFKTQNYWAKDIIFLISGNELLGFQAWLQAYLAPVKQQPGSSLRYLESDVLVAKAGVIQAALNLELKTFTPRFVQVKLEGMNGQLPNLDLFNLAIELCNRESVPVVFQGESFYYDDNQFDNWLRKARTMTSMMATQASMLPTGAHGLFQKYAISSITLETDQEPISSKQSQKYVLVNSLSLGRSIEGIIRSLNNMLEKFNRSFYFYLLASTRRFISISLYMIGFGLLAVPLAFRALFYYFRLHQTSSSSSSSGGQRLDIWSSFKPCFLSHLWGLFALGIVPLLLTRLNYIWPLYQIGIPVEYLSYGIFLSISLISMNPLAILWSNQRINADDNAGGQRNKEIGIRMQEYNIQSMVTLLNALLLFTSISLVNISLSLTLTAIYVPLLTILSIQDHHQDSMKKSTWTQLIKIIKSLLKWSTLLMIHPITLHLICLLVLSIVSDQDFNRKFNQLSSSQWPNAIELIELLWKHFLRAVKHQPRTIMNYIEDWYLFDNWSFPLATLFVFPVWLQLWFQSITNVNILHSKSKLD